MSIIENTMKYFSVPLSPQKEIICKEGGRITIFIWIYTFHADVDSISISFPPCCWRPSRILTNVCFTTAAKFDWALRSSGSRANWLINNYTHLGFIFYGKVSTILQHVCRPTHFSISQVNIYLFVLFCHQGWQQRELLIKFRRRCRPPRAGAGAWRRLAVCNTTDSQQY